MSAANFEIDTKGSCFLCFKFKGEGPCLLQYSFKRLATYLNIDFQNVYNVSVPNSSEAAGDVVVSLCGSCFDDAHKFFKLHMDWEALTRRLNYTVAKIEKIIKVADKDKSLVESCLSRISGSGHPIDLIQASVTTNLRKETLKQCEGLNLPRILTDQPSTSIPAPVLFPDTSGVSSTTSTNVPPSPPPPTPPVGVIASPESPVVVDLESDTDSAEEEGSSIVIKSVSGAPIPPSPGIVAPPPAETGRGGNPGAASKETSRSLKLLTCPYCPYQASGYSEAGLQQHMTRSHRPHLLANFRIPTTSQETFERLIDEVLASRTIPRARPTEMLACGICGKKYDQTRSVNQHLLKSHFDAVGESILASQRKVLVAGGGQSSNSSTLRYKYFDCPNESCKKVFATQGNLNKHLERCKRAAQAPPAPPPPVVEPLPLSTPPVTTVPPLNTPPDVAPPPPFNYSYVVKWKCGICGVTFSSQEKLKSHKLASHGSHLNSETTTFNCPHCSRKFKFQHSQRVHTVNAHRFQVFSKYISDGTGTLTPADIDSQIDAILAACTISNGSVHTCAICNKDFTGSVSSILQNHILVNHFQTVVRRLQYPEAITPPHQLEPETTPPPPSTLPSSDIIYPEHHRQGTIDLRHFINENDELLLPN